MGQSLAQMYTHLVFRTKYGRPYIQEDIEPLLHAYMAGILKNMESPALIINSVPDHIHILFRLSKNFALAKVVEEVKKQSSKWMKEKGVVGFTWQIGYGAFSVSSYKVEVVRNYILRQKEHHKIVTFKDEIEKSMKDYNITEYDAKYFYE
ncbi:IS200/IS605 family transposase [Gillisia limnaea]|uniref:Transposase n=1 Tax=Gillisia limnaea (strain DSM 15749 / LMG 21470 / R-8282) TaxID=865937 RepID=H2BVC5_GILLR|nr:IS200/IS605 family transposase [Gillisia limnaea]EHQ01790.1 transposase [Gillisia limnaea DSM 15749]